MTELKTVLATIPDIKLTASHMRLVTNTDWLHDEWCVQVDYNGKSHTSPYKTGIGHRKLTMGWKREGQRYVHKYSGDVLTDVEACKRGALKPQNPQLVNVIYNWITDASNANETFEVWADEFGYDTDSRQALATYLICQNTRDALLRMFGATLFEQLAQAEH